MFFKKQTREDPTPFKKPIEAVKPTVDDDSFSAESIRSNMDQKNLKKIKELTENVTRLHYYKEEVEWFKANIRAASEEGCHEFHFNHVSLTDGSNQNLFRIKNNDNICVLFKETEDYLTEKGFTFDLVRIHPRRGSHMVKW